MSEKFTTAKCVCSKNKSESNIFLMQIGLQQKSSIVSTPITDAYNNKNQLVVHNNNQQNKFDKYVSCLQK
jgi:hypothetical protein